MISTGAAALMILMAVLTVVGPAAGMLFLRRRGGRWRDFWVGGATFFLFAMVLEQILHTLVLRSPLGQILQGNIWLYGLYGGLAAGIFEETGRFLAFKLVLRNRRERITALSYGVGHGGMEAFLLLAVTYFNNLYLFSVLSNGGTLAPELTAALENLAALPAVMYLWAGLERVIAITIHMTLSVLVFTAVTRPGKRWLFPAAIGLHAAADFSTLVSAAYLPVAAVELLAAAWALALVWLAVGLYKKLPQTPENP